MTSPPKQFRDAIKIVAALSLLLPLAGLGQIVIQLNPSNAIVAVGGGDSSSPITSPDGRFVLFASTANNLALAAGGQPFISHVPGPMNVFLRDRQSGLTTLVSVNTAETGGGNDDSFPSALSDDGRYVVFESAASDLVPGDTNGVKDIFLRDLNLDLTALVSVSTNGGFGNGESREATLTSDGRYVAFVSAASNLVPNDTNRTADVFVRDLQAGVTTLASVGATAIGNLQLATPNTPGSSSEWPTLSADGRYVAFYSTAIYLLPKLTNTGEIYVRDLVNGATFWASTNAHNIFAGPVSANYTMSPDGQFVAYYSSQTSLVVGHPGTGGVFRYHVANGATDVVATNGNFYTSLDYGERPLDLSTNGQFVTFMQTNVSLVPNTPIFGASIQIWNAQSGAVTLVSGGVTNAICSFPRLDATGRYVAFLSDEASLTTNGDSSLHVYVRDTVGGGVQLADVNPAGTAPFSSPMAPAWFSASGELVAWSAPDGNLAASARKFDVFARDLSSNTTQVVSAASPALGSVTGFGSSSMNAAGVSSNGQFVAFSTDADGLAPNDTNGCRDIFLHNLVTGLNTLVSVSADGTTSGNAESFEPATSASGRYVIFASAATNLVPNDTYGVEDIFVRDLQSNVTTLVSVDATGQGEGNGHSSFPVLSADGRFALFLSTAKNLVINSVTATTNVYWRDLSAGVTHAITTVGGASAGAMTPDGGNVVATVSSTGLFWQSSSQTNTTVLTLTGSSSALQDAAISANGQKAAFGSSGSIYVVDLIANTNELLTSVLPTSRSRFQFSADGRFLACLTAVSNTNQLYLYDLVAETNQLISRAYNGPGGGDGDCDSPVISADGRFIAYRSFADNLVPGDTNGQPDVFLYDRLSGGTTLVSVSRLGARSGNSFSLSPVFSPDSQTLFFQSWSSDLAPNDFNQSADIFALALSTSSPIASTNAVAPLGFSGIALAATNGNFSSGSGPALSWTTAPGVGYQVQFKNSLSDPQWQNLTGPSTVVGSQGSATDPAPNAGQRFYRIVSF